MRPSDSSVHVETPGFCSGPIKCRKKYLPQTLDIRESSFPVLDQESGPSWDNRSLVSGPENKFELTSQSLASDPHMGFFGGLVTLVLSEFVPPV